MSSDIASLRKRLKDEKVLGNKDKLSEVLGLLQQDRHGNTVEYTDKQMKSVANIANVKDRLSESVVEDVVKTLTDKKLSVMHQLNKKQLAQFILKLNKSQIHTLAEFLVPFLNAYSDIFVDSLSPSQICEIWEILWPYYLESILKNNQEAELLLALGYDKSELVSALEFASE